MTVQGTPATNTESRMSSAFWPRLEPEMVTMVPPSNMLERGSIYGKSQREKKVFQMSGLGFSINFWIKREVKLCTHRVDDGGGTRVLYGLIAGV